MIWDYGYVAMPRNLLGFDCDDGVTSDCQRAKFKRFLDRLQIPEPRSHFYPNTDMTYRTPTYHEDQEEYLHPNWDNKFAEHGSDTARWHKDNDAWSHIAIWATNGMTEARLPGKKEVIYEPAAKHLLVIDNQQCWHRAGRDGYNRSTRHFLRIGVFRRACWKPLDKYQVA